MKWGKILAIACVTMAISVGCTTTDQHNPWDSTTATVFVQFASHPSISSLADSGDAPTRMTMASTVEPDGHTTPQCASAPPCDGCSAYHTVLWGGAFGGQDVTYASVPLAPGAYTFGLFDQNEGAAYQGWIDVGYGGGVLECLTEWRDTVREQKRWLGFDSRISGQFSSLDDKHFEHFMKSLRKIERLERRIDRQVQKEIREARRQARNGRALRMDANLLMMPVTSDFFRCTTQPTFTSAELAAIRSGEAITKVVFVSDSDKSEKKLRRVNELWSSLQRRRAVLAEELKRLRNRKRYFQLTDHLQDHSHRFVKNERCIQKVKGMLDRLDYRMATQRKNRHALLFASALFSRTANYDAFDAEVAESRRELTVLRQKMHRADLRFENAAEDSCRRVALEGERQHLIAKIEELERRIDQIAGVKVAVATLRESTSVIHRQGPARVLTTVLHEDVPTYLVDALEREALMTVRMQAADSMFVPPRTGIATAPALRTKRVSFRD